ncbi:SDR family oxidoreductase [Alicyclobacillus sp. ALC3]|uniref:SDR family oxidoreductase n=1 Tax=Alicyclobacillus sp. ALC3 TaxID=2796143 RepID=UPI00237848DD|nr:SDR family oxidoreductase [Alicyclobacillus sp. ALC3]WDL95139.1 SDR family oxidoreductase [Alicyclobacillus sp. ALC3]
MSLTDKSAFDLLGKVALVTGGLGILGRPFCEGLAERGASVVVVDLDEGKCTQFAAKVARQYGNPAMGVGCDVAEPESVRSMTERVVRELGGLHILINNAASKSNDVASFFAPFETYTLNQWRDILAVNLDGAFLVAQSVGNQMISQGTGGSIVQMSSIYGLLGPDDRIYEGSSYLGVSINTPAVYSASKAGIVGLTRYLATRWARYGIRVNCITPGGVQSGQNDTFVNRYSARVPLQRMARPEDLVGPMVFLASAASSYITGQNLFVDGGLSAW